MGQRTTALNGVHSEDGAPWLRVEEAGFDRQLVRAELADLLTELPPRQRLIVYLRFFREMTQSEIGAELSLSQVQVSRLLRSSLAKLRACSEGRGSACGSRPPVGGDGPARHGRVRTAAAGDGRGNRP